MAAEAALLQRLAGRLEGMDMLDLGVGAGRTTAIFAPRVARYVGVDYSAEMIERARARPGLPSVELLAVADARDLARWHGRGFDLVLFSFNGIDYVDVPDRRRILGEVGRCLADDGIFAFGTHSLHGLPLGHRLERPTVRDPVRPLVRSLRRAVRVARLNRGLDLEAARARGWTRIRDDAHGFSIPATTYVDPAYELRELRESGFAVDEVLDASGAPVPPEAPGSDAHLFYVCRRSA
jgi:SAM-dependent methyltransferase